MSMGQCHRKMAAIVAGVAFLAASGFATTAQATVFDFGTIAGANGGQEQGNPGENDLTPVGLRFVDGSNSVFTDGFAVTTNLQVIATGELPGAAAFAYLDGPSGGRKAGLGVCKVLTSPGKQCNPNDDDNVTMGESLTLTFSQMVTLADVTFKGENHFDVGSPTPGELQANETLIINGMGTTFGGAVATLALIGAADVFTFAYGGGMAEQFYVSIVDARTVPEPGTLGILGIGITLLGFAGRRRNAA